MSAELGLVTQLAIILIAAGVCTVICKALNQPLTIGYIIAGFIVGPGVGLFPQFSTDDVKVWSEIGMIFLLFHLGLEFSPKKLVKVGSGAFITAGTTCLGMFIVGIIGGSVMGWTFKECIFLGGLLSMSSTTIIIKAYDDLSLKDKPYASLVFGTLVVEDLIAVLLMVLLSTFAVSDKFAGLEMALSLGKLGIFIALCFLVGIYLIPTILDAAEKYLTDEILLLVSIGLCFLMAVIASACGFSSVLGAFFMGSILSSTKQGGRIAKITLNIKNLFGAIFFISVGMMISPEVIVHHWGTILVIAILAMGGILIFSTTGAILSGQDLNNSVHVGFTLAQLGEFSFIIAGVGCTLGVMRDFIYPTIIAVSVITTFTTPYMIKLSDPACRLIERKLPQKYQDRIASHTESSGRKKNSDAERDTWMKLAKKYLIRLGVYGLLTGILWYASDKFFPLLLQAIWKDIPPTVSTIIMMVVTLIAMIPFLYNMGVNYGSMKSEISLLLKSRKDNLRIFKALAILRIAIVVTIVLLYLIKHIRMPLLVTMAVALLLVIIGWCLRVSNRRSRIGFLEKRFMDNLNAGDDKNEK